MIKTILNERVRVKVRIREKVKKKENNIDCRTNGPLRQFFFFFFFWGGGGVNQTRIIAK